MAIPKQIHKVGVTDRYIHALIVAGPGFGKTVLLGSAEHALFLTTDPEGTISAWAMGSEADEWECKHWDDINAAYIYLRDGGIKEMGLKWVMIDNASEAQALGMKSNMQNSRKAKPQLDEFVPTLDNHQRTQIMFLDMVKKFHDLPVNVLWTTWAETHEDGEGQEYFAPSIHGQKGAIAQQFAGMMNVVGYGQVTEEEDGTEHRVLWFSQSGPYRGKDRYIALGRKRTDLTIPKMEALIAAAIKKRLAERQANMRPGATAGRTTTKATARRRTTTTRSK